MANHGKETSTKKPAFEDLATTGQRMRAESIARNLPDCDFKLGTRAVSVSHEVLGGYATTTVELQYEEPFENPIHTTVKVGWSEHKPDGVPPITVEAVQVLYDADDIYRPVVSRYPEAATDDEWNLELGKVMSVLGQARRLHVTNRILSYVGLTF